MGHVMKKDLLKGLFLLLSLLTVDATMLVSANSLTYSNKVTGIGYVYRVIDGDTMMINADSAAVYGALKSYSLAPDRIHYLNDS